VLFFGSSLIIWCPEALPGSWIEFLEAPGISRVDISVSLDQALRYCCSIVELFTSSRKHGILLSTSVMNRFTSEQQLLLRNATERVWTCELGVCESIGLGSTRDFVVPLTY
jgi:hypothetical protein